MNKKVFKLELETISPIIIGNGITLSPLDYYCDRDDNSFYKLNILTFIRSLLQFNNYKGYRDTYKKVKKIINEKKDLYEVQNAIKDIIDTDVGVLDPEFGFIKHGKISSTFSKELMEVLINQKEQELGIAEFIHVHNKPYLPGSSLKGLITSYLNTTKLEGVVRNIFFRDVYFSPDNLIVYKLLKYNRKNQQISQWKTNIQGLKPETTIESDIEVINIDNILDIWEKNSQDYNNSSINRLKVISQEIPQNQVVKFALTKLIHEFESLDSNEVILPFGQYSGNILNLKTHIDETAETLKYIINDESISYLFGYIKLRLTSN